MATDTIFSNQPLKDRPREINPEMIRTLLIILLISTLLLLLLNTTQSVFIYRVLHNLSENGSIMLKLDGIEKTADGMNVLLDDESGKLSNDVSAVSTNINTITEMVRDLNANLGTSAVNNDFANTIFHLRFVCSEADSEKLVSSCPIVINVLSTEPVNEFETQGNNQEPISLPLRIRLSIVVEEPGYKPYASVFEFTETGTMQDYLIKLEKIK